MNLSGTPIDIINVLTAQHREIPAVLKQARGIVPPSTRAIAEYQAAALYALAKPYQRPGVRVLEIGTAQGYSAAVLALALPDAEIVTLNPHHEEAAGARQALAPFSERIQVQEVRSWDYLDRFEGEPFDVIFVDGDHKNVRRDFPWWEHLRTGGLMLFHDFSPNGTYRACPPVYRALLELKQELGRDFDVLVVDDGGVGMAGFVKRAEDTLDEGVRAALATAHTYSSASYPMLVSLYQLAEHHRAVDGVLVECGAQNGGSAAALALGLGGDRKTWLFDSFEGVPMPMPEDGEKAMQRFTSNPEGWAKGDVKTARECFRKVGLKAPKVVAGQFADTLSKPHDTGAIAVLHVDATLHDSTLLALRRFYDDVADGGVVILSAYHHWEGIRFAVAEFLASRGSMVDMKALEKAAWWVK